MQAAEPVAGFSGIQGGIQERGGNPRCGELIHLILHQRDKWGHHQRQSLPRHGRQLETERFPASGRQQREDIPPRHGGRDDFLLQRAPGIIPKVIFEQVQQAVAGRGGHPGMMGRWSAETRGDADAVPEPGFRTDEGSAGIRTWNHFPIRKRHPDRLVFRKGWKVERGLGFDREGFA